MNGKVKPVYVTGTFDMIHPGHTDLLIKAREFGNYLTVGLNTDEFSAEYKRLPIMPYEQRRHMLLALRYVDEVNPRHAANDWNCFRMGPGFRVSARDKHEYDPNFPGLRELREMGIEEVLIPRIPPEGIEGRISTSAIIQRIIDRHYEGLFLHEGQIVTPVQEGQPIIARVGEPERF